MNAFEQLSCQELVELLTDYLGDAMPDDERRRFEQHLDGCGGCRNYVEQVRTTVGLVGGITIYDLDRTAEEVLLDAFRDWKSG